jgi:hypothetical protein
VSAGDLDSYNKLAVGIAKKYFALPDIDDYYKKKDARPLIFCHFARGLGERWGTWRLRLRLALFAPRPQLRPAQRLQLLLLSLTPGRCPAPPSPLCAQAVRRGG